ncbi:response regulator [Rufibacter immobilis]|uniref:response regulator n=1 Tax=Rufibacter immobilis TaxID=1348778 RepID=UPI0035EDB173
MQSKQVHILLVEDDPLDVATITGALHDREGETVIHVAHDAEKALDMLQGNGQPALVPTPQIILLNLKSSEQNSMSFLKELRQDSRLRFCSVFIMTNQSTKEDIQKAYSFNVAGYIIKPIQHDSFLECLATLHSYWNLIELPY